MTDCDACRIDATPLTADEISHLPAALPGWEVVNEAGIYRLRRAFSFSDFAGALAFVNQVGALAEAFGHHPDIRLGWGRAEVDWWTHKIQGLHALDVELARRTSSLFSQ